MKYFQSLILFLAFSGNAGAVESEPGLVRSEISPNLIENISDFQDSFFKRFELYHAPQPLKLTNNITKNYFFPTLYGDVTTSISMFYCDYQKAVELMPNPSMKPISMGLGRSLIVISSYHYSRVYGISSYNEVAIALPVVANGTMPPPVLPLVIPNYKGFGFYVLSMPVTSVENQVRGKKLWGLNKVTEQIEHIVEGSEYVTRVHESTGEVYLELRVPMTGHTKMVDSSSYIYSILDSQMVRAKTSSKGSFNVNSFYDSLVNNNHVGNGTYLRLGDSSSADLLKSLKVSGEPFQLRFSSNVNSVFDLPERGWYLDSQSIIQKTEDVLGAGGLSLALGLDELKDYLKSLGDEIDPPSTNGAGW